ncbi:MAG: hypothetical protein BGP24_00130 [Lysobacterales bacterium 69-70]|nr:MAG: hypothetical protein ABS97_10715 [Xanthomonadaceae bacterium SCN 69-320]ODV21038.1 MAG: hypothetical protein ABT27_05755 [Xanthomonadaceae bacterium SCN 69-25]OJY99266.1 MAG: hypothetical protein BGP24_00130 [Xanthomonadales bacterium 69-70]
MLLLQSRGRLRAWADSAEADMQRASHGLLPILLLAAASAPADRAAAQSATASLRITLDAEAVEIVRAWRRNRGLDAPDPQADARVAALLQRLHAVASEDQPPQTGQAAKAGGSDAPSWRDPASALAAAPLPQRSRDAPVVGPADRNDLSRDD